VLIGQANGDLPAAIAIHPESLCDFMAAYGLSGEPEASRSRAFRRLIVSEDKETRFEAVERRGYRGFVAAKSSPGQVEAFLKARELWHIVSAFSRKTPRATGARTPRWIEFWQWSGATWPATSSSMGSEHTGSDVIARRSSRSSARIALASAGTITIITRFAVRAAFFGFDAGDGETRVRATERYYAGAQAGWGAQILEQPVEGLSCLPMSTAAEETEMR